MRKRSTRARFTMPVRDVLAAVGLSTLIIMATTMMSASASPQAGKKPTRLGKIQVLPTGGPTSSPLPTTTPSTSPSPTTTPTGTPAPTPTPTPSPSPSPTGTEYSPHTAMTWPQTIPWTTPFKASAGETVLFNVVLDDVDGKRPKGSTAAFTNMAGPGPYELVFTCGADAEFDSAGSGLTTKTISGKSSGNVTLVIKSTWTGAAPITVTVTGKDKDPKTSANPYPAPDSGYTKDSDATYSWTINKRVKKPTTLTNVAQAGFNTHGNWVAAPAKYAYLAGPDAAPAYQGESILETFGTCVSGGYFAMADLTAAWKTAYPGITTADQAAGVIFNSGGNGTFVIDAANKIYDQHSGFGDITPFTAAAQAAGIGYRLPQSYKCDTTVLASFNIDRKYNGTAGVTINKN